MFNMRDRAKWDAWKAVEGNVFWSVRTTWFCSLSYCGRYKKLSNCFSDLPGKSKDEAMSDYITKVKQLREEASASAWFSLLVDAWCHLVVFLKLELKIIICSFRTLDVLYLNGVEVLMANCIRIKYVKFLLIIN
jgi:acyl-CoA-binding protein